MSIYCDYDKDINTMNSFILNKLIYIEHLRLNIEIIYKYIYIYILIRYL